MRTNLFKNLKTTATVFLTVPVLLFTSIAPVYAAGGNNGTLKVHEIGTPVGTEDNDPKVCAFNFEGFGFDPSQSGYIMIKTQGGSSPVGVDAGPFAFGPTNTSGYAISQDFNNGGVTIVNGTYKATLYGKNAKGNINLADEKAKSKVFKVNCQSQPTAVTAPPVAFVDECGTADDTYTIPQATGVDYQIDNTTVSAGAYPGSGTVTVKAVAQSGYALSGTTSWSHTFTNEACPATPVTPTAPTNVDLTCDADGSYTIPQTTGVIYKVNNTVAAAGTYPVSQAGTIDITTEADSGYILTGTSQWSFIFHTPTNCTPPPVDICPNIPGVQTQVPTDLILNDDGDCVQAGGRGGGDTPPTDILDLFAPSKPIVTTNTTTNTKQLVNTGRSAMLNLFVGLFIISTVAALSIAGYQNQSKNRINGVKF